MPPGDISGLAVIVILLMAAYGGVALATFLIQYTMIGISQRSIRDLRQDLFDKLQTLTLRFFDA